MIGKFIKGDAAVFIDAANILYSQQTLGWKLDYSKLKNYLENECHVTHMYFYTGNVGDNIKQQHFLQKLIQLGYKIKKKEIKKISLHDNSFLLKGNLDIELALDAYRTKDEFRTLLLFSGDSDFAYLLDLLKQQGKTIVVLSTRGHVSRELVVRAKFIDLQKLRGFVEFKIKGPQ
jgi:uncharacterized LabA/DUF88 family protein